MTNAEMEAMIEEARRDAHDNSRREWSDREMDKLAVDLKRKKVNGVLREVQEGVKTMRKDRMRKIEHYLCDCCDKPIPHPRSGFVIQGNIYVADPSCKGGLIGNNFPTMEPGKTFSLEEVQQTVLCRECFGKALSVNIEPDYNTDACTDMCGEQDALPDDYRSGSRDDDIPF